MILKTFQTRTQLIFLLLCLLIVVLGPFRFSLASEKCILDDVSGLEVYFGSGHELRQLGQRVSPEALKTHLQKLTGELPLDDQGTIENRYSEENKKRVADFLLQTLASYGFETYFEESTYLKSPRGFWGEREEGVIRNVVGELKGSDSSGEIFEIVAHYDSENKNAPGADDNGSGVVTSLEIARIFAELGTTKTLRVVFTDLEETSSEGADLHLESVKENNETILGALILDQFGYAPLGPHRPTTIIEVGEPKQSLSRLRVLGHPTEENYRKTERLAKAAVYQFSKYSDRFSTLEALTQTAEPDVGDHGTYWINEVPALFFSTPQTAANPHTHRATDQISNMNWMFFLDNARFAVEATALFVGPDLENLETDTRSSMYWEKAANPSLKIEAISMESWTTPTKPKKAEPSPTRLSQPAIKPPEKSMRKRSAKRESKPTREPQVEISLRQDPLDQAIERGLEKLRQEVKDKEAQKEGLARPDSDQQSPESESSDLADDSSRIEEKEANSSGLLGALKKVFSSSEEPEK